MSIIDGNLDSLKYEIQEESRQGARIKVVGVGGCGLNAVAVLLRKVPVGPEFYAIDTDAQALAASNVPNKIQIGASSPIRWAPAPIRKSAIAPPRKIQTALSRCYRAPIWCSLQPA